MHVFQNNADIRCMAIQHFGQLLQDMSQYTWMLNPVALRGLVPLILFLEDPEIRVVEVSPVVLFFLSVAENRSVCGHAGRRDKPSWAVFYFTGM